MRMQASILMLVLACFSAGAIASNGDGIWLDASGDAVVRRTDVGNDAILPEGFVPIDLLRVQLEGWLPDVPALDPYAGSVVFNDTDIMRMQIVIDGLVAPPGPLAIGGPVYNPDQFGDRPLYGYFEIDIDDQKNSGGELMPVARNRYLANVGRFGLSPAGSISERIVRNGDDLDTDFFSQPQFERTGGEFTLLLCGCFEPTIVAQDGNTDSIFDEGETWVVSGRFFERFTSFQDESGLFGGFADGLFDPVVELQFIHDLINDETTITLVYPITNTGAAMLDGGAVEPIDLSLVNQTSIEEAIDDLIVGASFATGPLGELVNDWDGADVTDFRRPRQWSTYALLGTAPVIEDPSALFIWTDTGFGEVYGDLNDDDFADSYDSKIIVETIDDLDGTIGDADGVVDGSVIVPDFAFEFNLADLNGDGAISTEDIIVPVCPADLNIDGVLNFFDISVFLSGFASQDPIADFTGDGVYNFFDVSVFLSAFAAGCS